MLIVDSFYLWMTIWNIVYFVPMLGTNMSSAASGYIRTSPHHKINDTEVILWFTLETITEKYPFTIVNLWRKAEDAEVRDFRLPSVEIA